MSFSYRNIIVTGYDRIKNCKPTLFVSNHQNTFMDGLVLVKIAKNISPNILVRADIFKSKWAAIALDIIHLIPIYRKKDNMGSVAQNNEIFKKCFDLFKRGKTLLIFPEGNHAIKRFLRPMQKGLPELHLRLRMKTILNLD
ncbi:1-acyl-sn-glycerol-3-phosphate acyltransferase [Marivirga harenae]|uniref:1-acyl-sn-glycerol-3-phosphate acyltransferase n=1 Tax=Marivirga harenae TaxID=2010992 RepID=UPI0026E061A3|nr:1-acyl-sn-glycerol-3-phosphate acyltransferase [Marivirga harenae]WKV13533.1 1-acyl-sn-glycerol-3-phosphate acyltransferase [Marivirga harenae]